MKALVLAIALFAASGCAAFTRPSSGVTKLTLPPGFAASIHATGVEGARMMAVSPAGTLFVGTKTSKVWAIPWPADGVAAEPIVFADGLEQPNGVAFRDGALYVAERRRILRFPDAEKNLAAPPAPEVVTAKLPRYAHHGLRVIGFGPDGRLYVAVGAPCNICEPERDKYGVIYRVRRDGELEVFARGVR
ncbi:MAG: PQQ-dependent sugar dehydrogenase, partial [Candidatus Binatia bacterium]